MIFEKFIGLSLGIILHLSISKILKLNLNKYCNCDYNSHKVDSKFIDNKIRFLD